MSYRYYNLMNAIPIRKHQSTTRPHTTLNKIEPTMRDHKFSSEDPVSVFDFLTRVVKEAYTLGMSEGQLIVCLPHLLTTNVAQHFRSASSNSRSGGLVCWPDAVKYLFRTYSTEQSVRKAVEHLYNILQVSNEDKNTFESRFRVAAYHCRNVHTQVENITIILTRFHRQFVELFRYSFVSIHTTC